MEIKENNTIGDIVAKDYRTAAVFKSFGIDFCCGGGKTLQAACKDKNVDISELNDKLEKLDAKEEGDVDFLSFEVNELIDHIESRHHTYVEEKLPVIAAFLKKLESVHGVSHPELKEVKALFNSSVGDLAIHMKKEELVLFPYINKLNWAVKNNKSLETPHFDNVKNPIRSMVEDHEHEGEKFKKISTLTKNYEVPQDGCKTYFVTMHMLKEFEEDLHKHIHLENNILFPKAQVLEDNLLNLHSN